MFVLWLCKGGEMTNYDNLIVEVGVPLMLGLMLLIGLFRMASCAENSLPPRSGGEEQHEYN
jgi:hypothetical protein